MFPYAIQAATIYRTTIITTAAKIDVASDMIAESAAAPAAAQLPPVDAAVAAARAAAAASDLAPPPRQPLYLGSLCFAFPSSTDLLSSWRQFSDSLLPTVLGMLLPRLAKPRFSD